MNHVDIIFISDWAAENNDPTQIQERKRQLSMKFSENFDCKKSVLLKQKKIRPHSSSIFSSFDPKEREEREKNPFQAPSEHRTTIDGFFNDQLYYLSGMEKLDKDLEKIKGACVYRIMNEDFDKKEFNFCKKMIAVKSRSSIENKDELIEDSNLERIDLKHKLIGKKISVNEESKRILEKSKDPEVKRYSYRKNKEQRTVRPTIADLVYNHRKIFRVENVVMLRKKMEKDPIIHNSVVKRTEFLQSKAEGYTPEEIISRTNEMNKNHMENLTKANSKMSKMERSILSHQNIDHKSSTNSAHTSCKSMFDPKQKTSLGNSTKGIYARNVKNNIFTIDQLVMAALKKKHLNEEDEKKRQEELQQKKSEQENISLKDAL